MSSPLFAPLTFRSGLQVPNRIALAPMTNQQSHDDGTLGDDELHFLLRRADGGFGSIMTCASHVTKDGQGWPGELGSFDDAHVPSLARVARGLEARGAKTIVQIFHGGLRANEAASGLERLGPSAVDGCREATLEDIARIVEAFAAAAARAKRAACHGVEIHGAHGYLLTQFLSRTQNQRSDAYGGSLENRARLAREVVSAVRAAVGPGFLVGIRISPEDFGNAVGLDLDESAEVARSLAASVDYVHLSLWRSALPTTKRPEAHALEVFREVLPADVRLVVAGQIATRAEAEALLAKGADMVALGRIALANPDWPRRVHDPAWEPRRPPHAEDELVANGLSPKFATYMRSWKGFVEG